MQITTRQTPSFGVARVQLAGGEQVKVESGAMMMTSAGMALQSKAEGGVFKSLKRAALGGESFFVTTYEAPNSGGWVDVAARLPGDLIALEVSAERPLIISRGSWLASSQSVELNAKWGGFKNLAGAEGGFIMHAAGSGPLVLACYGALETWDLQPGEAVTLDTGHMVAYDASVTMTLRKAAGGIIQSMKSGEGLVFDFVGPGRLMTQTRNPNELVGWIQSMLPNPGGGGAGGIVGGIFGRE
jgi:uncharacterized protein (TIGR00266 family)